MLVVSERKDHNMIATLPETDVQTVSRPAELPELAGRRELIELVLAETQVVGERVFGACDPIARTRARTLLSLLTYCYAADILPSEDIQWATAHDAGARYLCAGAIMHRETIREFRRANRPWIEQALTQVLHARSAEHPANPAAAARRKLELAVIMDTALCD